MLMGAMVRDFGTPGTGALEMLTSGGAPMSFFASRLGPVNCHDVVTPARVTPWKSRFKDWADSVGLTTATVRNLRSLVKAAETSSGNVGLPALTRG